MHDINFGPPWASAHELVSRIKELSASERLEKLHALSVLAKNSIFSTGFSSSDEFATALKLNSYGKNIYDIMRKEVKNSSDSDIVYAMFITFYHHDIFFQWEETNLEVIEKFVHNKILQKEILLPCWHGRTLYDKFNDHYAGDRTTHLLNEDVLKLLEGLEPGVFQVGYFVTGPFGISESKEARFMPPILNPPLWHCSDTGCNAFHNVNLIQTKVDAEKSREIIVKLLKEKFGPPSEWAKPLGWLHRGRYSHTIRNFVDLPNLLSDSIVNEERTNLLARALQGDNREKLRRVITSPPRNKTMGQGPLIDIAKRLNGDEQLQLLLLLPDEELVQLIDKCVFGKEILVPLGEIRHSKIGPPQKGRDAESEFSSFGLRSLRHSPLVNTAAAILRAYKACDAISDLAWRVNSPSENGVQAALASYLRTSGPIEAVKTLIFASPRITDFICKEVNISLNFLPRGEEVSIDRILWKLGYYPMQFSDTIPRLKRRLDEFSDAVISAETSTGETLRERIRSAGVNLFVSVEEFLDLIISYNVWLFSSDHFEKTKFEFSLPNARNSVLENLGKIPVEPDDFITWNARGENPLGTLLGYLTECENWIASRCDANTEECLKPVNDLPHFANDPDLPFPFVHTALWADLDPEELKQFIILFKTMVKMINQSNLAAIRNGIDHFREPNRFPTLENMRTCSSMLKQALDIADTHRLVPKEFWLSDKKVNHFGQYEFEFKDYAGKSICIFGPALAAGLPQPSFRAPLIIAPGHLLGFPHSELIFSLKEKSIYTEFWKDYPKRRKIPAALER